jgi:uncharacterized protein
MFYELVVLVQPSRVQVGDMEASTPRSKIRRTARASYDPAVIAEILDEGLVAHVGFVHQGSPVVIPMFYVRLDDSVVLHGAVASRLLAAGAGELELSVAVTLLDGLVLGRSAFRHSLNYRSVVIFGHAYEITDDAMKLRVFDLMVERMAPGRTAQLRPVSAKELAATRVVRVPIEEASAKSRTGAPLDDQEDLEQPVWAGVLPVSLTAYPLLPDRDADRFALPKRPRGLR